MEELCLCVCTRQLTTCAHMHCVCSVIRIYTYTWILRNLTTPGQFIYICVNLTIKTLRPSEEQNDMQIKN